MSQRRDGSTELNKHPPAVEQVEASRFRPSGSAVPPRVGAGQCSSTLNFAGPRQSSIFGSAPSEREAVSNKRLAEVKLVEATRSLPNMEITKNSSAVEQSETSQYSSYPNTPTSAIKHIVNHVRSRFSKSDTESTKHPSVAEEVEARQGMSTSNIATGSKAQLPSFFDYTPVKTGTVSTSYVTENDPVLSTDSRFNAISTQARLASTSLKTVSTEHPVEIEISTADIVRLISKVEGYLVDYQRKRIIWIDDKSASPFARLADVNSVPDFHYRAKLKWSPPTTANDSFALYRAYLIWGTGSEKPEVDSACFSGRSRLDITMEITSALEGQVVLNHRMAIITSFLSNGVIIKEHENYLKTNSLLGLYKPIRTGLKRAKKFRSRNKRRIYMETQCVTPLIQPPDTWNVPSVLGMTRMTTLRSAEPVATSNYHAMENLVSSGRASASSSSNTSPNSVPYASEGENRTPLPNEENPWQSRVDWTEPVSASYGTVNQKSRDRQLELEGTSYVKMRFFKSGYEGYWVDHNRKEIYWIHKVRATNFDNFRYLAKQSTYNYSARLIWNPDVTLVYALYEVQAIWNIGSNKPVIEPIVKYDKMTCLIRVIKNLDKSSEVERNKAMTYINSYLTSGILLNDDHREFIRTSGLRKYFIPEPTISPIFPTNEVESQATEERDIPVDFMPELPKEDNILDELLTMTEDEKPSEIYNKPRAIFDFRIRQARARLQATEGSDISVGVMPQVPNEDNIFDFRIRQALATLQATEGSDISMGFRPMPQVPKEDNIFDFRIRQARARLQATEGRDIPVNFMQKVPKTNHINVAGSTLRFQQAVIRSQPTEEIDMPKAYTPLVPKEDILDEKSTKTEDEKPSEEEDIFYNKLRALFGLAGSTLRFQQAGVIGLSQATEGRDIPVSFKPKVPKEDGKLTRTEDEKPSEMEGLFYNEPRTLFDDDDDDDYESDDEEKEEEDDDLGIIEDLSTNFLMKLMLKKLNLKWKNLNAGSTNDNG